MLNLISYIDGTSIVEKRGLHEPRAKNTCIPHLSYFFEALNLRMTIFIAWRNWRTEEIVLPSRFWPEDVFISPLLTNSFLLTSVNRKLSDFHHIFLSNGRGVGEPVMQLKLNSSSYEEGLTSSGQTLSVEKSLHM